MVALRHVHQPVERRSVLVAELQLPVGGLRLTVSIGVAEYQPGEPLEDCLRRCDAALYRAKDGGRNAVVAARGGLFAAIS